MPLLYVLKMVTIKEIKEIFGEKLQEHENKQEGMFTKHKKNGIRPDIRTSSITKAEA